MEVTTNPITQIMSKRVTCGGIIIGDTKEYIPLVDWLLINKLQLTNKSRQKITSSVFSKQRLKPFQMFIDSKQNNKPFILGGFQYSPMENSYEIQLYEYDNTTNINLLG